jgi:Gpi18-like mannosyltransferase
MLIISKYKFNITTLIGFAADHRFVQKYFNLLPQNAIVFEDKGHDGQDYYFLAKAPKISFEEKNFKMINRILYPLLCRIFSFGKKEILPYTMVFINLFASIFSVIFLIKICKKYNISPWFSLIYCLNPGLLLSLQYSLTEPLCMLFIILGIFYYEKKKILLTMLFFSFAMLTRVGLTCIVIGSFLLFLLVKKSFKNFFILSLSLLPYIIFQIIIFCNYHNVPFISFGVLGGDINLPFIGLIKWSHTIEWQRRGIKLIWELGTLFFVFFIILTTFIGSKLILKQKSPYIISLLAFLIFSFCLTHWDTIVNCIRPTQAIFLFHLLSFLISKDKFLKYLFILSLILTTGVFFRAITYPIFPYIIKIY